MNMSIETKKIKGETFLFKLKKGNITFSSYLSDIEKSREIENLFIGLQTPMIYVISDREGNWEVVKGNDFVSALNDFIHGGMVLEGLEYFESLEGGFSYETLPDYLKNLLNEIEITVVIINPSTPADVRKNIIGRIK